MHGHEKNPGMLLTLKNETQRPVRPSAKAGEMLQVISGTPTYRVLSLQEQPSAAVRCRHQPPRPAIQKKGFPHDFGSKSNVGT